MTGTTGGVFTNIDINGGAIDGVTIGTNSVVTDLKVDNLQIDGNAIISTDTNGNIDLTPDGTGEVNISKVDINSGTIDGSTIATSDVTVGGGKTLDVSAGTLTLASDQISGDKVEGGTINAITINTMASGTVDIDGGAIDGVTIGTNSVVTDLKVDQIQIDGNIISTFANDDNILVTPNGTGAIQLSNTIVATGAIKDEDNMSSDSAVHLVTQQSVKSYVDAMDERQVETFTLNGTDISNKYVTLAAVPTTATDTILSVQQAPAQFYDSDFKMHVSNTDRLIWDSLALDGVLTSGDKLTVVYAT